ncbi:MAG: hypothetical protein U1C49_01435 [Candidatus Andersenbacteria bacterium]|nr:hypothetical protein [Candidatus Andersenbacteria bacterium]
MIKNLKLSWLGAMKISREGKTMARRRNVFGDSVITFLPHGLARERG